LPTFLIMLKFNLMLIIDNFALKNYGFNATFLYEGKLSYKS
jgi:hypothetical protein